MSGSLASGELRAPTAKRLPRWTTCGSSPWPTCWRNRGSATCAEFDIPRGYASHTELLQDDDIDAVAVVLGHQLHHRLTVDALNAGKHVLVEKPMALSLEHCDAMIAAADANHRKLMVGLTQHFYPTSITAKSILDSGDAWGR